jgi:hypothetical protein
MLMLFADLLHLFPAIRAGQQIEIELVGDVQFDVSTSTTDKRIQPKRRQFAIDREFDQRIVSACGNPFAFSRRSAIDLAGIAFGTCASSRWDLLGLLPIILRCFQRQKLTKLANLILHFEMLRAIVDCVWLHRP